MDDGIGAGERLLRLAQIGQVGDEAQPERAPVVPGVHVQDVVAVLAQVAHDPRATLAGPAGDDDPHARNLLLQSMPNVRRAARRPAAASRSRSHRGLRTRAPPSPYDGQRHDAEPRRRARSRFRGRGRSAAPRWSRCWSGNAVLILAMWLRHGGLDQLDTLGGQLTAIGQLTGAVRHLHRAHPARPDVAQPVARPGVRDGWPGRRASLARVRLRLAAARPRRLHHGRLRARRRQHRGRGVRHPRHDLPVRPDGARQRRAVRDGRHQLDQAPPAAACSYETWYGLHLYAYLAIALGFLHQLYTGNDFIHDPVAVGYWVALYVATAALVLAFRVGQPVWLSVRHRPCASRSSPTRRRASSRSTCRVATSTSWRSAPASTSYWRFLTRDGWWRAHPFSISSAPNGAWLRITIKELGDWSTALRHIPIGTRVFIEGPYGAMTGARRTRHKVLFIAGGIGITPLRALLEALPGRPGDLMLLYRVRDPAQIVFRAELEELARARDAHIRYVTGRRDARTGDPLGADALERIVPDILERDVYLCGPVPMMERVEATLRTIGVPDGADPRWSDLPTDRRRAPPISQKIRRIGRHPRATGRPRAAGSRVDRSSTGGPDDRPAAPERRDRDDADADRARAVAPASASRRSSRIRRSSPAGSPSPDRSAASEGGSVDRAIARRAGILGRLRGPAPRRGRRRDGRVTGPDHGDRSRATTAPDATVVPDATAAPGSPRLGGPRPRSAARPSACRSVPGAGPGIGDGSAGSAASGLAASRSRSVDGRTSRSRPMTAGPGRSPSRPTPRSPRAVRRSRSATSPPATTSGSPQDRASDGTYTVTAIIVVLPSVAGQVSAIDGDTITITQPGGTEATIHVDSRRPTRSTARRASCPTSRSARSSSPRARSGPTARSTPTSSAAGSAAGRSRRPELRQARASAATITVGAAPKASPAPSSGAS